MAITPGPWTFDKRRGQVDCEGGTICHDIGWAENGQAIGALPEVLQALCDALPVLQIMKDTTGGERVFNEAVGRALKKARAAIAKAEGR